MSKRLSDEDVDRIAEAVAERTMPKPIKITQHISVPADMDYEALCKAVARRIDFDLRAHRLAVSTQRWFS